MEFNADESTFPFYEEEFEEGVISKHNNVIQFLVKICSFFRESQIIGIPIYY
jgi:hypothetical protein